MKVVNIEILPIRDGDRGTASIHVEKRRGDAWVREKVFDVTVGAVEAKRKLLIEDDERIVVLGSVAETVVFDKEQNAAVRVPAGQTAPPIAEPSPPSAESPKPVTPSPQPVRSMLPSGSPVTPKR